MDVLHPQFFHEEILMTWLDYDVKALLNLEIAMCHSSLSWEVRDMVKAFKRNELGCSSHVLASYLRWVAHKKISIDYLHVWADAIQLFPFSDRMLAALRLRSVHTLTIFAYENDDISPDFLRQFLAMLPSLTKFTGWEAMTDQHLDVIREIGYQLTELTLTNSPKLTAIAISRLICSISSSLEVLHCNYLDDHVLEVLSRAKSKWKCQKLHTLRLDCRHVLLPVHIFNFCRSVCETLRSLWLENDRLDDHNCLTRQLALTIANECKNLTSFHFGSYLEGRDLEYVLQFAPELHSLTTATDEFSFSTETNSWTIENTCSITVLRSIKAPISHLRLFDAGNINKFWFRYLAEQFGTHLVELSCPLDDQVDDETMRYVLSRLPNVEQLAVYPYDGFSRCYVGSRITEASLSLLPSCCPKIKTLSIHANITDAGMCAILDGYKGSNLSQLTFTCCSLLTDVTLIKIAETFPAIRFLSMQGSSITKYTVLDLFCRKKLPVMDMLCPEAIMAREEMDWVCTQYHRFIEREQSIQAEGCSLLSLMERVERRVMW